MKDGFLKTLLKAALILPLLLISLPCGLRAQSLVDGYFSDGNNPTAYFQFNTTPGNAIVAIAGCSTSTDTCNSSIPTDQDGDKFTQTAVCTAGTGTAVRSIVYTAFNIVGGNLGAVHTLGTNLQFIILELHNVNAIDTAAIACNSGSLPRGGTATSGNVTTTKNNEIALGLGTASCPRVTPVPNFAAYGSGWSTGSGLIGSQLAERQILTAPATVAATATVQCNGDPTESYAMVVVPYYQSTVSTASAVLAASAMPAMIQTSKPAGSSSKSTGSSGSSSQSANGLQFLGSLFSSNPILSALAAIFNSNGSSVGTPSQFNGLTFGGYPIDGAVPRAPVVIDGQGNLYGTTVIGGAYGPGTVGGYLTVSGYGTVYKVSSSGTESVLHSFTGGTDAANPYAGLIVDSQGNLYGTSTVGGTSACGCGTVFKITPNGTETILYNFKGGLSDGGFPYGTLVMDQQGNLYGTTEGGGTADYAGTVFKLAPNGTYTILHRFARSTEGANPYAGLVMDKSGILYGTTEVGGINNFGTVFKVNSSGASFAVLHTFLGGVDGAEPYSDMTIDAQGNLFGTTLTGGSTNNGTVFKVDTSGHLTVLYSFKGGTVDGSIPVGGLVADAGDNLYGTTLRGGSGNDGTVFKVTSKGVETVLQNFTGGSDGGFPYAGLALDGSNNLYGTTQFGGNVTLNTNFGGGVAGDGTLFSIANPYNTLIALTQQKISNPFQEFFMVLTLKVAQNTSIQGDAGSTNSLLNNFISQVSSAKSYGMLSSADATTLTNQAKALMM
jgi:uncharacterized repeat protein (TIGR03803 family)